jgi:hypothetical protein
MANPEPLQKSNLQIATACAAQPRTRGGNLPGNVRLRARRQSCQVLKRAFLNSANHARRARKGFAFFELPRAY